MGPAVVRQAARRGRTWQRAEVGQLRAEVQPAVEVTGREPTGAFPVLYIRESINCST